MTAPVPSSEYDVYVSAAPEQADAARAISGTLTNKGLRVAWFGDETGGRTLDDITDDVGRSRLLVALFTTEYLRHPGCQIELSTAWFASQHDEGVVRVVALSDGDDLGHVYPLDLRGSVSNKIPKATNTRGLGNVAKAVQAQLDEAAGTMGRAHSVARPPWHGIMPETFPRFTGRYPMMWAMHDEIANGPVADDDRTPCAINLHGLAGLGKSLLAREYALRFGSEYPGGVFWLRAYGADDPVNGLGAEERVAERDRQIREFAGDLGVIIANRGPMEIRMALGDALGRRQRQCLWIVDDLPAGLKDEQLRDWMGPHPLATTIITSRERQPRTLTRPIEVTAHPPADAAALFTCGLERVTDAEMKTARQIADLVGYQALAVDALGCTSRKAGKRPGAAEAKRIAEALDESAHLAGELTNVVLDGYEGPIAGALAFAIKHLSDDGRDFMRVASMLAPAPILPTLLSAIWSIVGDVDGEGARELINRSWADADAHGLTDSVAGGGRERSVHPVVSRMVRLLDPVPARLETLRAAAVNALRSQLPSQYDPSAYASVEHEISHARELVRRPTTIAEAELLGRVARYDLVRGAYESAGGLFKRQADAYQDIHGDEHPETASAIGALAGVMFLRGDVAQARRLHEQALTIRRETLGDDHDSTLASMNNLATLLGVEGQLVRARELQQELVDIKRRHGGPGHPDTLIAMNNLCATLDAQGELEMVRDLQQEVLAVQVRRLGPEHPTVTNAAWNLYATLSRLRDERGAGDVLNRHLTWLLEKEPSTLGADQQHIRSLLAEHRQL